MTQEQIEAVKTLINAAKPFLDSSVVDETSGTISLMQALEKAIEKAEAIVKENSCNS